MKQNGILLEFNLTKVGRKTQNYIRKKKMDLLRLRVMIDANGGSLYAKTLKETKL